MSVRDAELRVRRTLVDDGRGDSQVRIHLTSEAESEMRFRLTETLFDRQFSGSIAPGETTVIEYTVPADVAADGLDEDAPLELTTEVLSRRPSTDGGSSTHDITEAAGVVSTPASETRTRPGLPAFGIVGQSGDADAVSRTAARAVERGHPVYVAHPHGVDAELDRFIEQLGGTVVVSEEADSEVLHERLADAARADGHPGLLVCSAAGDFDDFEASMASFEEGDQFSVDVVTKPEASVSEPEPPASTAPPGLVVGIPAYNEADRIANVVDDARAVADTVIVVDDGSDDETAARAAEAGAHVVEHDRNRGYGAALNSVFTEAATLGAETLAIVDGDGQHDVTDVPRLVRRLRDTDADVVIGSRFVKGSETNIPAYRRFGVGVINGVTNLALGRFGAEYIHDTQSGFRVYDGRAIRSLAEDPRIGNGMNASTDVLFHIDQYGYNTVEESTTVRYDLEGTSTMSPLRHGLHLLWHLGIRTVEERPLWTIGLLGVTSVFLGVLFTLGFHYFTDLPVDTSADPSESAAHR